MNLGNHNNMVKRAMKHGWETKWPNPNQLPNKESKQRRRKKRIVRKTQKEKEESR